MRSRNDRTANTAVSHAYKEQRYMADLAVRIRTRNCNPTWAEEQEKRFTGIYKRLLTDPIEEVQRMAKKSR